MFVGGLSWQTTPEKLREYFGSYGTVRDVLIMKDPVTQVRVSLLFIVTIPLLLLSAYYHHHHYHPLLTDGVLPLGIPVQRILMLDLLTCNSILCAALHILSPQLF